MLFRSLWTAVSAEGGRYVAVFNTGEQDSEIELPLADLELSGTLSGLDIWSGSEVTAAESIKTSVKSHGARAFYFKE